jgi:hypothetical protein
VTKNPKTEPQQQPDTVDAALVERARRSSKKSKKSAKKATPGCQDLKIRLSNLANLDRFLQIFSQIGSEREYDSTVASVRRLFVGPDPGLSLDNISAQPNFTSIAVPVHRLPPEDWKQSLEIILATKQRASVARSFCEPANPTLSANAHQQRFMEDCD